MKRLIVVVVIAVALLVPAGIALPSALRALLPTQTPYPTSTPYSLQETYTPLPTRTPTLTPSPTFPPTATPTASDTPSPTATNTDTPAPTDTPTATATVTPTDTPEPTYTPLPTYTPADTPTLYPTATPWPVQPTLTPRPTYTPQTLAVYEVRVSAPGVNVNWCDVFLAYNQDEMRVLDLVEDTTTLPTVPVLQVISGTLPYLSVANYSGGLLGELRATGDFPLFTLYGELVPPGQLPTTLYFLYGSLLRHTACYDAGVEVAAAIYLVRVYP